MSILPNKSIKTHLAEVCGSQGVNVNHSLWDTFSTLAKNNPDSNAVLSIWQESDTDQLFDGGRVTFSGLKSGAELIARSVFPDYNKGAILVVTGNSMHWALMLWVAARLQVPFTSVRIMHACC
jgi:hypothetical protein